MGMGPDHDLEIVFFWSVLLMAPKATKRHQSKKSAGEWLDAEVRQACTLL